MGAGPRLRGVECRRATRRHRERPTAAPAPPHLPRWKEKARLLRTPLRQGRLFGGTGQRGGGECPALPELLAHRKRQRRRRVPTARSWVFVCGGVSGAPLPPLPGSASVPCARVLAKSEEPPPRTRGRERTTSGAATQR